MAAPLPALATFVAILQALHAASQVAAFSYSALYFQAPPAATQLSHLFNSTEVLSEDCSSSSSGSTESKSGAFLLLCGPTGNPDDDPDKNKRDNDIDNKRRGKFLIDSTAPQTTKS